MTLFRAFDYLLIRLRPASVAALVKYVLRYHRQIISTKYGIFSVDTASNFGFSIAYENAQYEPAMLSVLDQLLTPGDIFLDLGANEGFFLLLARS